MENHREAAGTLVEAHSSLVRISRRSVSRTVFMAYGEAKRMSRQSQLFTIRSCLIFIPNPGPCGSSKKPSFVSAGGASKMENG